MKNLRSLSLGLLSSFASSLVLLGVILIALTEGLVVAPPVETPTEAIPIVMDTLAPGLPTITPRPTATLLKITATAIVNPTCPIPAGWVTYTVLGDESFADLAALHGISLADLLDKNCVISISILTAGTLIKLPPLPTPTPTYTLTATLTATPTLTLTLTLVPTRCGPPPGWVRYIVQAGDNLFQLSLAFGTTVPDLQLANCMAYNNIAIHTGQTLWVPNVPTRVPTRTATTPAPPSKTPVTPTRTPTVTLPTTTRTATPTPTGTSTATSIPTSTATGTGTATATPAPTHTSTPTPEPPTPTPTATSTTSG